MIKSITLAFSVMSFSSALADPTLEERVTSLEKRLAELEAARTKKDSVPTNKKITSKKKLVFHDGFEKGTSGWVEEVRYLQPERMVGINKNTLLIQYWEKFRTTKELPTSNGGIKPKEGKRFLTAASQEKGVVIVNSKANVAHNVVLDWRAVHYFSTKNSISLKQLDLPTVSAFIHMQIPRTRNRETRPGGMFIIGYYPEGGDLNSFKSVGKITENTKGWEEVEFDFSNVPKNKMIHLSLAYVCMDSRNNTSTGLQIDDIKIFDDGQ